jgi:hypothetical protein
VFGISITNWELLEVWGVPLCPEVPVPDGCSPPRSSRFRNNPTASTVAGSLGSEKGIASGGKASGFSRLVLLAASSREITRDPAWDSRFFGRKIRIDSPITMIRKIPTETATNNNFFFSIINFSSF